MSLSNPHGAQTLRGFRAWRHRVIEFQVKTRYDMILSEMSEAKHARSSSKWVRGFFDTKVGQQDYFECVCGGYLPEDMDDK